MIVVAVVMATVAAAPGDGHQPHLSLTAGAQAYLSTTRTMGGVGGSIGVREVWRSIYLFEADVSYLFLIGNVVSLRVGGGLQWPGTYSPAATVNVGLMVGDRFAFLQPGTPLPGPTPTMTVGVVFSPIRFWTPKAIVSVLQIGAGFGTEFPALGRSIYLGLLEISVPLR